jgi:hypothetical protein
MLGVEVSLGIGNCLYARYLCDRTLVFPTEALLRLWSFLLRPRRYGYPLPSDTVCPRLCHTHSVIKWHLDCMCKHFVSNAIRFEWLCHYTSPSSATYNVEDPQHNPLYTHYTLVLVYDTLKLLPVWSLNPKLTAECPDQVCTLLLFNSRTLTSNGMGSADLLY